MKLLLIDITRQHRRTVDDRTRELLEGEVLCAGQIRASKYCSIEKRTFKICPTKVCICSIDLPHIVAAKRRTAEIGSPYEGAVQIERALPGNILRFNHWVLPVCYGAA